MILRGKTKMRILFIGCVESSKIFLETLLEQKADIVGVITKSQSKSNADFVDLAETCIRNNIKYLYVDNINDMNSVEFIRELKPDTGFCLGWSQLLKEEVLSLFPRGVVGFHPAALPNNRGRHPIIWALALGLQETASSFFMLDTGADTGKVISQIKIPILYEDTARTLYDKIMNVAAGQLTDLWRKMCEGDVCGIEAESQTGNAWRKRNKNDGKVDWRMAGRNIYNLVRALSEPYVGAHFEYGHEEYKVWETREVSEDGYGNLEPGKIISVSADETFTVKTGNGLISIVRYDKTFKPEKGMYL